MKYSLPSILLFIRKTTNVSLWLKRILAQAGLAEGLNKKIPRAQLKTGGFTLVELLVIISIIAILAVVGFSVFGGAQAQARDARRRAEIGSLAKAIESSKDPVSNIYIYTPTDLARDFPTNLPAETTGGRFYCIASNATVPIAVIPPSTSNTAAANGCPSPEGTYQPIGTGLPLPANTMTWTLCSYLEIGATPFCVQSYER